MVKVTEKVIKRGKPGRGEKNSISPTADGTKVKPTFDKKVFDQGLNGMNPQAAPSKVGNLVSESVFKHKPNSMWPN